MTMEDALGAASLRRMRKVEDDGVSPVIGMILVLAISILGMAAILYWGLPAIDEMKANVEHRSVQSQFLDLDGTIKELVAGTTEKTAKRWLPTINRGEINVKNNTESRVSAVDMAPLAPLPLGVYDVPWHQLADCHGKLPRPTTDPSPPPGTQVNRDDVGRGSEERGA